MKWQPAPKEGTEALGVRPEKGGWEQARNDGLAKEEVHSNELIGLVSGRDENNLRNHKKATEKTEEAQYICES